LAINAATSTSRYYSKDFFIATTFLKASRIAVAPKTASGASNHPTVLGNGVSRTSGISHCGEDCKAQTDQSFFHRNFQLSE
jgi:hypothetical protein